MPTTRSCERMILTYVPVSRGDSILAYRRGTYNRVDKFLQGATCVGFGGHVVETDLDLFNVDTLGVFECAVRELTEERWNAPAPSSAPLASTTAQMPTRHIRKLCTLDEAGERTLEMAVRRMGLSARAHDRILKLARTIADLGESKTISAKHVAEAVQHRSLDRNYWN